MRTSSLVLAFLLLTTTAHADERLLRNAKRVLQGSYIAAGVWDAYKTVLCVRTVYGCYEANPVLKPIVEEHGIEAAMTGKVAFQVGVVAATEYFWRKYPEKRPAILGTLGAMLAFQLWVNKHNATVIAGRP